MDLTQVGYILRIILAGICGIIIGMERKNRSKEAGIRTHFVVSCGAALIMIVSKYAFFDIIQQGMFENIEVRLDPSRVASTIASGIGFLGAGMIFVHKNTVTGLTTAAGIWATSGVGMAIGAGLYIVGIGATVVILVAQFLLHIDFQRNRHVNIKFLSIKDVKQHNFQSFVRDELEKRGIEILDTSIETTDDIRNYQFKLEIPNQVNEEEIITLVGFNGSIK